MTSNSKRMDGRTILRAARRKKVENSPIVTREVSPNQHTSANTKCGGNYSARGARKNTNVPTKYSSNGKDTKPFRDSKHACSLSPPISSGNVKCFEDLMPSCKPLDKSFKIPKKESKVVASSSCVQHVGEKVSKSDFIPLSGHDKITPGSKISPEYEDMDWETTVLEIKDKWPGSHFIESNGGNGNAPSIRDNSIPDNEMDVDSEIDKQLIIVPDTNIWLSHLSVIREVLDVKFKSFLQPIIVIPWMVLQELDIHGKNQRGPSRAAVHFIHRNLCDNHPRIKGQKASDAAVSDTKFVRLNADDSILQCAMQCQKEISTVVLLTNDINLKNKAMVNGVVVADCTRGIGSIRNALQTKCSNSFNSSFLSSATRGSEAVGGVNEPERGKQKLTTTKSSWSNIVPAVYEAKVPDVSYVIRKQSKRSNSSILPSENSKKSNRNTTMSSTNFGDILTLIQETLSHVIETKMKDDYGDPDWLNIVKIPPPWTAKTAVQCIVKHYVAVFTEVFGRKVSTAEKLLRAISQYEASNGKTAMHSPVVYKLQEDIIECVLGMFNAGELAMDDIVRVDPIVAVCRQTLLDFRSQHKRKE